MRRCLICHHKISSEFVFLRPLNQQEVHMKKQEEDIYNYTRLFSMVNLRYKTVKYHFTRWRTHLPSRLAAT